MKNNDIKKLYELRKQLTDKEANIYETIYSERKDKLDIKAHEKINEELYVINNKIEKVENMIMLKKDPIISDEELDLRKVEDELEGKYFIFLHNKNIKVGFIEYKGYHKTKLDADAGIYIEEQYRGNSYAYKATNLLKELLYNKGISDFWVSAQVNNIPSIKTIRKLGGVLLENPVPGVELYKVPTKKNTKEEILPLNDNKENSDYEKLLKLKEKLQQMLDEYDEIDYDDLDEDEYLKITNKKEDIEKQIYDIDESLIIKSKPSASNDKIDLRKNIHKEGRFGEYYIYLHGTNTKVGIIDFQTEEIIGGLIYEQYRGNHYLSEALNLLSEILYEAGIEYFYPIILKDNIASIKSVERYGGKLIRELDNDMVQYECKTKGKDLEDENNKKL